MVLAVKDLPADARDAGSIPAFRRSPPLEKKMATHFSILAWKIPCTEEPGRLQSMGLQESDTTEHVPLRDPIEIVARIRIL